MSEFPPKPQTVEYASPSHRPKTNPLGRIGLLLGILACAPALLWILSLCVDQEDWGPVILAYFALMLAPYALILGLAALITSLAAFRFTPKTASGTRMLAGCGLLLGIITSLVWGDISRARFFAATNGNLQAREPDAAAVRFLNDLSKSPQAAAMDCDTTVALSDLSYATTQIQTWGGLGNLTVNNFSMDSSAHSNVPSCAVDVTVSAPRGTYNFAIRMKKLTGGWKVYWYRCR
jgi:hypothetical protein